MHCFYAATSKLAKMGSLQTCLEWGEERLQQKQAKSVQILKARSGEKQASIIGELSAEGFRALGRGRYIPLYRLKKADNNGAKE